MFRILAHICLRGGLNIVIGKKQYVVPTVQLPVPALPYS